LFEQCCRSEIEFLEQAVAREREKYQLSTQAMSSGLSAIPVMAINDSVIVTDPPL
jgi:Bardet-Biedl syndrome 7 protein